jgi:lipopolysaccharide export system permease protein
LKTIERYVFGSFLSSFGLAFLVLSFVLTIGLLIQIVGYIMDGVPMSLVGEFCAVSLPETLQWSMPLALLVSAILVFSRMSADSEISAMRACGINLLTVMKYPVIFGILCTFLGFWINNEVVPRGHEVRRTLKTRVSVKTGISLLEPGRVIDDFPKMKLYFAKKEGNWLYDLVVIDYSDEKVERMITADKALVTQRGDDIDLELYRMTIDPVDAKHRTMARANRFVHTLKDATKQTHYTRRMKDYRFAEMLATIKGQSRWIRSREADKSVSEAYVEFARRELSTTKVELSKRFVFSMASICFVLIGIPLGIRSQRKESSIGMAISLAVSLGYYVVVILMLSCEEKYAIYPWYLIWLPVVVCGVLAVRLIRRHL